MLKHVILVALPSFGVLDSVVVEWALEAHVSAYFIGGFEVVGLIQGSGVTVIDRKIRCV